MMMIIMTLRFTSLDICTEFFLNFYKSDLWRCVTLQLEKSNKYVTIGYRFTNYFTPDMQMWFYFQYFSLIQHVKGKCAYKNQSWCLVWQNYKCMLIIFVQTVYLRMCLLGTYKIAYVIPKLHYFKFSFICYSNGHLICKSGI